MNDFEDRIHMLHHVATCCNLMHYIMLHHATLLETRMPAASEDMVAAVTNGPAAGIATTSDAQLQIDVERLVGLANSGSAFGTCRSNLIKYFQFQ